MFIEINGKNYPVEIIKKNNKNTYIRVDENLVIKITTNYFTSKKYISRLLEENKKSIEKMLNRQLKRKEKCNTFFYLGKSDDKIYIPNINKFNKWYKNQINEIFSERYNIIFNKFTEVSNCPILKIRTMKTRWGVYNKLRHSVTLNSRLIEYSIEKLDYVIVHELSHVIHFNHSSEFWNLVSKYCPEYKRIRKELKE